MEKSKPVLLSCYDLYHIGPANRDFGFQTGSNNQSSHGDWLGQSRWRVIARLNKSCFGSVTSMKNGMVILS